jgi:uncharacterized surface protein with fasciclin (FAS1) repeats
MKKKLFFIVIGIVVAGGSIWYILNGGQDTSVDETSSGTSANSQSDSTEVQKDSVAEIVKKQKDLKLFNELIVAAGITSSLQATGPFTVLAPTDDALKALPEGVLESLKKPENKEMLTDIVNYHIVKGSIASSAVTNAQKLPTVNGQEVIVEISDNTTYFISAKGYKAVIKKADITASNGQIHTIDTVLLPQ